VYLRSGVESEEADEEDAAAESRQRHRVSGHLVGRPIVVEPALARSDLGPIQCISFGRNLRAKHNQGRMNIRKYSLLCLKKTLIVSKIVRQIFPKTFSPELKSKIFVQIYVKFHTNL
jgi:hypothetical protein